MILNFQEKLESLNETGLVVNKPWGFFRVIEDNEAYKIKLIHINPHSRISLQEHEHRTEHWTITQGEVYCIIDGVESYLKIGDSAYVPANTKHRLINETDQPVELVEVQLGDYLDESDITRFEDIYGRL